MSEIAETTPEEFLRRMREQFQASKARINEDLNRLELECERIKPNSNNYDLGTQQGRKKLAEAQAVWMEAARAANSATTTWTDFFKDLVDQAVRMLSDNVTAIVKGITFAYTKLEEFMLWFADRFVKKANTAPQ